MKPMAAWLSVTGSVLGIAQTAVKPPAAAAMAPVATVSSSSWPGSRRCTWRSMRPGVTILPAGVEHQRLVRRAEIASHRRHLPALEVDIGDPVGASRRIDDPAAADQNGPHRSSRLRPWAQSGDPPASR